MPRLVSFFLAFVLRNKVFTEPVYQRGLKRALEQIEWAKKELPLTHTVGIAIPDAFNEACRECFGRQGGINWSIVNGTSTTTKQKGTLTLFGPRIIFSFHILDASIRVTDLSNGATTNVALPTEAQMQLKDAIEDNVDMKVSVDTASTLVSPISEDATDNGWGTGWGNEWANEEDQNAWAQSVSWGNDTQDGQEANGGAGTDTQWGASADPSNSWNRDSLTLFSLLGPSAFPLTHTTGIIECSTRRVSAIHFPPNHPKGVRAPSQDQVGRAEAAAREKQDWAPSAEGVEAELDACFAKVILEPWGPEEGDIIGPEIWTASRGPVIDPNDPSKVTNTTARRPHDPLKDSITLLVQPSFAETLELVPGLGLGAMWIEIAKRKSGTRADASGGAAEVDNETPGRFWYHEDVTGIFPSFYTPQDKA